MAAQHDPRWTPTNGKRPLTDDPLRLRFRNGRESKQTYTAKQIQWGHHRPGMCDDFDVVAVRKA